jgi:hypothetical protein
MGDCTPITSECGTDWWFDNAPKLSRERLVTSTKTHYYSMGLPAAVCNCKCLQYKTFHQTGNFAESGHPRDFHVRSTREFNPLQRNSLRNGTGNFQMRIRESFSENRELAR